MSASKDKSSLPYVLIVEDEARLSDILEAIIARAGFKVVTANDGEAALRLVRNLNPDLVLADVMLPKMDGFELCRRIRSSPEHRHIPVMFLSAKDEPANKYQGFEEGGCDYITKPFDPVELILRIKAHIHVDFGSADEKSALEAGEIKLDPSRLEVIVRGSPVHVSKSQMALLKYLMTQEDRIVSVDELSKQALGHPSTVTGGRDIVRTQIRNLRLKIEQNPDNPQIIQTIGRAGYTIRRF